MIPGLSTGGGGFDGGTSGSDAGGSAGGVGDKFATIGGGKVDTSLFSNTGIKFGNKGIDTNTVLLAGVGLVALMFYFRK